jgi:hypothetical protein
MHTSSTISLYHKIFSVKHVYTIVYRRNIGNQDPQETPRTHHHLHYALALNFRIVSTESKEILLSLEAMHHGGG